MTTWQDFENEAGKAITQWICDENNGQLMSKRYDDGKRDPDHAFPKAGCLKERIWARGEKTDYKYNGADDLGRILTEIVLQPGIKDHEVTRSYNDTGKSSGYQCNKGEDQLQVEYGYHTFGRLNSASDGEIKITNEYLAHSNLIEHTTYHSRK